MTLPFSRSELAAVELALGEAVQCSSTGDVPVGAVVLDASGRLIGSGRNRRELRADPTAHAEIEAIRAASAAIGSWRLSGCTLAVTLEPCVMCAGAIVDARIERVLFGAWDERFGAAGSVYDVLRDRRLGSSVEVIGGVQSARCAALLDEFFAERRG